MRWVMAVIAFVMVADISMGQTGKVSSKVLYERQTVGTTTAAATSNANKAVWGWTLCHETGSAATYLALSESADPETDGHRLVPGACYDCSNCGEGPLRRLQVKAQAAGAPYVIIQRLSL